MLLKDRAIVLTLKVVLLQALSTVTSGILHSDCPGICAWLCMLHQVYALWFFWKAHKIGTQAFWSLLWQHLAMRPWKGTPVPWLVLYKLVKRMRDSVHLSIVAIVPLGGGTLIMGRVCICGGFLFVVV